MTNRRKKTKRSPQRSSGYRDPKPVAAPAPARRSRLLDTLFMTRSSQSPPGSMPRIRTALARGVVTVIGSPALLICVIVFPLLAWAVLIAVGYQGPFAPLANLLALPPIGTSLDATLATSVFGLEGGLIGILAFLVVRAIVLALLTSAVVSILDEGGLTGWGPRRAIRALPVAFAVCIIGVGILTVSSFAGQLLGPGFGILLQVGALVLGEYLFAFSLVIALDEARSMPDSLTRSIRAARIPGAGNLTLAALYVVPSIAVIVAPGKPGNVIGVNPTIDAWVFILAVNLLHVAVLSTFAFRYLSIAAEVPDGPVRPPPPTKRGRG